VDLALLGLALSVLASSLGTSAANVALPALSARFSAPFSAVQWVVVAYLLTMTLALLPVGRLGDARGRRRVLVGSLAVHVVASVACATAPTLALLVAARAAQGLGAAGAMALSVALVGDVVPAARTGRAMGLVGATSSVGTALGPSLGGVLLETSGVPAVFAAQAAVGLAALALVRATPASPPLARAGVATPFDRAIAPALAASALVSCVVMTSMVVGPFYLSRALGLGAARVGLVMSIGSVVAAATGYPAGRLVDRLGARRTARAGLSAVVAGTLALALRPERLGVVGYVAPMAVTTAGYALFSAANVTGVLRRVGPAARGAVSGTLSLSRNVGLVAGALLMGAVFALAAGARDVTTATPHAIAGALRATYALAAALAALALGLVHSNQGEQP
jgi:MFS family permease